jgi:acetoin utilization deacetylase AcuC-like enzyme
MRDRAMGFCFLNNVAIAARYGQRRYQLRKIAILDWDVHHGNGTQSAFYSDPSVLFISLHQENWYPAGWGAIDQIGEGEGEGYTINIPLPPGTGNAGYLAAVDRIVLPAIRHFEPELILISAGQDANAVDPLARMLVSADGFREMATRIAELADEVCGGRLVAVHEGGYSEGYAPICTWAVVEGLSGIRTGFEDPYRDWLGEIDAAKQVGTAAASLDQVIHQHGARWGLV